jgi:hypothetical protein
MAPSSDDNLEQSFIWRAQKVSIPSHDGHPLRTNGDLHRVRISDCRLNTLTDGHPLRTEGEGVGPRQRGIVSIPSLMGTPLRTSPDDNNSGAYP